MPIQNVQRGPNIAGDSLSASMTVTASGTAHTKGSWTQIFAATAVDAGELVLMPDDITVSATNSSTLVDIGIGGAGAEQVLIANINVGAWGHGVAFRAPVFIPAGTRVSIRLQSAIVSKVLNGRLSLIPATDLGDSARVCDTYGANTGTSAGVTLATPSVAGTKTGWTQIVAATTRDHRWIGFSVGSLQTNMAAAKGGIDLGVGGAGSEVPLIANARWEQQGTEVVRPCLYFVPCLIPAGSRISARWDSTSTAAGSVLNLCAYGLI